MRFNVLIPELVVASDPDGYLVRLVLQKAAGAG
jgi:hypothetical protein